MCDCGEQRAAAAATLRPVPNWFVPALLPRVVIWEPSGVVYGAHKNSQPGILATQTVSAMLLKWFSCDDRNGSICTG